MGNEQSSSSSAPSSSSFPFLPNKGSVKKSKGIVVVKDGAVKQTTIDEDEMYKRFRDIPKFLPILLAAIGKKDISIDSTLKSLSSPILRFSARLHEHIQVCSKVLILEQNSLDSQTKKLDVELTTVATTLTNKKKACDEMAEIVSKFNKVKDEVKAIQVLLEELVPAAETLNELLPPTERLPRINFQSVLHNSRESNSNLSTPRKQIDEIKVVDG
ncbi:unnamed protein product [Auanema sp. JU1783]|nr:unnamed protein product [Auanema sp. JU1783]